MRAVSEPSARVEGARAAGSRDPDHRRRLGRRTRWAEALRASSVSLALPVLVGLALAGAGPADAADPRSKVILNGKLTAVTFNDGDSFRVLGGGMDGAKARLEGFNTPESYGPVHSWGTWTEKELYVLAKMATQHARRGIWECETDGKTDTYGRMLVKCPGLAQDLVSRGLAHVLTVGDEAGRPELVAAQRKAIAGRRGMWSHGVPDYILTSIHSVEEDTDGTGTYNRLVSTEDGHSLKWKHQNRYSECDKVCHMVYDVDATTIDEVTKELRADATVATIVEPLDDAALRQVVATFARHRRIDRQVAKDDREKLERFLLGWAAAGRFGTAAPEPSSCMIHIDFKRRFGTGRAACLK